MIQRTACYNILHNKNEHSTHLIISCNIFILKFIDHDVLVLISLRSFIYISMMCVPLSVPAAISDNIIVCLPGFFVMICRHIVVRWFS